MVNNIDCVLGVVLIPHIDIQGLGKVLMMNEIPFTRSWEGLTIGFIVMNVMLTKGTLKVSSNSSKRRRDQNQL